ncbi:hypothetical protein MOC52_10840 [Bacillus inaquosorum]|uniref:hypothetical protein n=1 Tax=Bacillus inaquosorum TaxID=483913 RepID=UPI0022808ABB|nr:hypothetical protein [Bacillus inaquosorum]MCY8163103.1 hypothetical protein [Bacillus inaquosorum]MCY8321078.1 hypothetical protein [Bacillus inaquosorum]MCY8336647.1 hypothetical protein [Bacillus inaquosorum]
MEAKNEIKGKVAGQFQVNDNKYLIFEITSEEKARLFDVNINIGEIGKISIF